MNTALNRDADEYNFTPISHIQHYDLNIMSEHLQNNALLLIEDHQDIATMVYEYLERKGYAIDYAADGVTGLHLAVTNKYDAIILDLMLPGIDGMDVLQKIRLEAKQTTPILI